jgi:hypothetical protein
LLPGGCIRPNRLDNVVGDIREAVRRSAETLRTLSDEDLAVESTGKNPR